MREIVLDTETTGFDPETGDRIVEIGAVELFNHVATGRTFHQYINPQRAMPQDAFEVHGLGDDFLADKPVFAAIGREFVDFIGDARLVIHNAAFDMKFINAELRMMGLASIPFDRAVVKKGLLEGSWRTETSSDPRDAKFPDPLFRWFIARPTTLVISIVVFLGILLSVLLALGSPREWGSA
jgi:hypothetical protein